MSALAGGGAADLPEDFKERMRGQLGDDYGKFLASYDRERTYGLRYNPLKIQRERFLEAFASEGIAIEKVEWAREGYYYPSNAQPGKLALHEAGAYYIQEPSAMAVVELLDPQPGERILDLCAAPGGKSTQTAGRMLGRGTLLSNEVVSSRAKILSQNIERMGVTNAVVCNESTARLAQRFPAYFDRIVVDAPCSGEGMFRKDVNARSEWSLEQVERCAARQREILADAIEMLAPGGVLVYSTCTFAPAEDEEIARWLSREYPQLQMEQELRIWPHLQRGEGHYMVKFTCGGGGRESVSARAASGLEQPHTSQLRSKPGLEHFSSRHQSVGRRSGRQQSEADEMACLREFCVETLPRETSDWLFHQPGDLISFGGQLCLLPADIGCLDGLKTVRAGLELGSVRKGRFIPAHALAMALGPAQVQRTLELPQPQHYLRGETIPCSLKDGWALVTVQGCSMGWGKVSRGILKNHYPKGLRRELP